MSVERIKTLILTLLILICGVLCTQVWFEEKLWSDDYNFFSVSKEKLFSLFNNGESTTNINVTGALDSTFSPRVAVLSYTDGRITVNFTDSQSFKLRDEINDVIKKAMASNDTQVTKDEWQNALTSKGVYCDYSVSISFNAMGDFLGTKSNIKSFNNFDKMVVVTNNISEASQVPVYFCDSSEEKYLCCNIYIKGNSLYDIIDSYSQNEKQNISYAFEMNLDKEILDSSSHQKIIFDSFVRLNLDPVNLNVIEEQNIDVFEEKVVKNILSYLNVDQSGVKKYTQSDNTTMYVDSSATVTLSPDGTIEYEASENKGMQISEDNSLSSNVAGSAKLLDNLFSCFSISPGTRIFINSPLSEDNKETYTFNFDYLYNSTPIYFKTSPCSITVKNGRIVSLIAQIKNYNLVSEGKESNPLEVIDIIYESMGEQNLKIDDLYFGFFDKNGEITLSWLTKLEGAEDIIVIN